MLYCATFSVDDFHMPYSLFGLQLLKRRTIFSDAIQNMCRTDGYFTGTPGRVKNLQKSYPLPMPQSDSTLVARIVVYVGSQGPTGRLTELVSDKQVVMHDYSGDKSTEAWEGMICFRRFLSLPGVPVVIC